MRPGRGRRARELVALDDVGRGFGRTKQPNRLLDDYVWATLIRLFLEQVGARPNGGRRMYGAAGVFRDHPLVPERPTCRLPAGEPVKIESSSPTFCSRAIGSGSGKWVLIV
jgi:hypothetical protein